MNQRILRYIIYNTHFLNFLEYYEIDNIIKSYKWDLDIFYCLSHHSHSKGIEYLSNKINNILKN